LYNKEICGGTVGIFDRLGDVIKSYLNDEDSRLFGRRIDPDIEEAEEELESFLRGEGPWTKTGDWTGKRRNSGDAWGGSGSRAWGGTESGDWSDTRTGGWGENRARANAKTENGDWSDTRSGSRGGTWGRTQGAGQDGKRRAEAPPEELRPDFAEMGLPFGAGADECKAAYRRLLKLHHPDRHAGHPGNMEKATKKMARINAAYDRIEKWRAGKEI
jgi:hypothetical protein